MLMGMVRVCSVRAPIAEAASARQSVMREELLSLQERAAATDSLAEMDAAEKCLSRMAAELTEARQQAEADGIRCKQLRQEAASLKSSLQVSPVAVPCRQAHHACVKLVTCRL